MLLDFFLIRFHSASLEEGKEKEDTESKSEATEMLSPSEVVKMRKKARLVNHQRKMLKKPKVNRKKQLQKRQIVKKGKQRKLSRKNRKR